MAYTDLWRLETAFDEATNSDWYELGLLLPDQRRLSNITNSVQIHELESLGAVISLSGGNTPNDRLTVKCCAINAEPFKWMLGDDKTGGVWGAKIGSKPSISIYRTNDYLKYRARGLKMQQLDWNLEFDQGAFLQYIMSFVGGTHGNYATAVTNSGYYSSLSHRIGITPVFTWNSVTYEIMKVGGTIQQKLTPLIGTTGFYQEIVEDNSMHMGMQVMFKGNVDISAINTDMWAKTQRAYDLKMYLDSTHYIQLAGNAMIEDISHIDIQGKPSIYSAILKLDGGTEMTDVLT